MKTNKKVIIIGGGMAGLCAGTYLRMNGFDTIIYESSHNPGGLCTSWEKGKYKIDLCIHWLVGSGTSSSFYDRWNELIEMSDIRFVNHDEYLRIEDAAGRSVSIYTDLDRLESEFISVAPEDEPEIRRFTKAIRSILTFDLLPEKASEISNTWDKMKAAWKVLPYMPTFARYVRITSREYSNKFKNPLLQKAMERLFEPDMSILFGMIMLSWFHRKEAGYPIGGSLNFAMKIYNRYVGMGGNMHFENPVAKILTEGDKAVGVVLKNGEEMRADYVISAADGHATLFDMLGGHFVDNKLRAFYEKAKPFPSLVFVALGINRDLSDWPRGVIFPAAKPIVVDPETKVKDVGVFVHGYDPTLAPAGSTLVTFMIETYNFDYWKDLHERNLTKYESEKRRIAEELIDSLEARFGDVRKHIELIDISTPVTFHRFSGNWRGSFEGWQLTPETGFRQLPHTLPGLKNFYMCGQWVAIGGGLPAVLNSGREVAQIVCHEEGVPFAIRKHPQELVAA